MRRLWAVLSVLPLVLGGCTSVAAPVDRAPAAPPGSYEFVSRPDLAAPRVSVRTAEAGLDPGYVFLMARFGEREPGDTQAYAVVVDRAGELVWAKRFDDDGTFPNDLTVQTYRDRPVLTYWRGSSPERGWGNGEYVLLDSAYREIATVKAGNGYHADFHDLEITPRDTAYLMSYPTVRGNPKVREGVIQEIDIATGRVLFEWHSIDHVGLEESVAAAPDKPDEAFDYFHANSVDETPDGDLLVSARHTSAVYKIDRETGEVLWRMGGTHNDFELGPDVGFAWQHDARWQPGGRITLLDNASNLDSTGPPSRALTLAVDETGRTVRLVSALANPDGQTSGSQAGHQLLPSGNSIAGWGSRPSFTAFTSDGDVLLHAQLPDHTFSYRARLAEWTGLPAEPPRVVIRGSTAYVSWNGATEVARWRVLAGPTPDTLAPAAPPVPRTGFETALPLPPGAAVISVEALDRTGRPLAQSPATPG